MITYLEVTNEVLSELNEVLLTSLTFSSAVNIQKSVKDLVNRSYYDICTEDYKWPFLSVGPSLGSQSGNVFVPVVKGTRWYLLNPTRTNKDSDYAFVEWDRFYLTNEDVIGAIPPYKTNRLRFVSQDYWLKYYASSEEDDRLQVNPQYGRPVRIIRNSDNIRFGLSPIPDEDYRVYIFAYNQPQKLSLYDDVFLIPDKYISVLISKIRYYAWQMKENYQQASIALGDFRNGIRKMREQLLEDQPNFMSDDRVRFAY